VPLYEYECDACGRRFEVIQKFSDPAVDVCRQCGKGPVRRLFSSPAIQFKGTGWYITDYAQKGKSEGKSDSSSGTTTKSDSAKSDKSATESTPAKSDSAKSDSAKSDSSAASTAKESKG
jgi:putative FmdB family regulatory protein